MSTKSAAQLATEYRQYDLERTIDQLRGTVESLEKALENARSDVMELAQAREQVRAEREDASRAAQLEKEVEIGAEELAKQRQAYQEVELELAKRDEELKKACAKVALAEKESESVRNELAVAQQALCAVRAEHQELNARHLVTRSELDTLRAENSVYRTSQEDISHVRLLALSAREKELDELRTATSQERTAFERALAEQRESLERDLAQTRDEAIRLRQDAAEKDLELQRLRERLAASQREIAELHVNVSAPVKIKSPSPARRAASSSKAPLGVVIDLSADSEDEATGMATLPGSRPLNNIATDSVKVEGGTSVTPLATSSQTNIAHAEPGLATLRNPDPKQLKRAVDDVDVRLDTPSKPSKRMKQSQKTGKSTTFDLEETDSLRVSLIPSLNRRVSSMTAIPFSIQLDGPPSDADPLIGWVRRDLVTKNYKASPQNFHTTLKHLPGEDPAFKRPAIFAAIAQNPGLPQYPGQPGTLIVSRKDILIGEPMALFVRAVGASNSRWQYMGEYELEVSPLPVTPEEWKALPDSTRDAWAKALSCLQSWEEYLEPLVRMAYRREGKPTDETSVADGVARLKAIKSAKKGGVIPKDLRLTHDEVLAALERGDETVDVITLRPLSVNAQLYQELWDIQTGVLSRNPRLPRSSDKPKKGPTGALGFIYHVHTSMS